jgi:hypothetical protein
MSCFAYRPRKIGTHVFVSVLVGPESCRRHSGEIAFNTLDWRRFRKDVTAAGHTVLPERIVPDRVGAR